MKKTLICFFFLFFHGILYAQHYHWIENGTHHFSNYQTPPLQKGKILSDKPFKENSAVVPESGTTSPDPWLDSDEMGLSGQTGKKTIKPNRSLKRKIRVKGVTSVSEKSFEQAKEPVQAKESELEKAPVQMKEAVKTKAPELEKESVPEQKSVEEKPAKEETVMAVEAVPDPGLGRQDDKMTFSLNKKAAEQGDTAAQFNLGIMYSKGQGVIKDDRQAGIWFNKALEHGTAGEQANLGYMYLMGEGVPQDDEQAVYWYKKAAEQGDTAAQFNLGIMYTKGRGVDKDDEQAALWYKKAAGQGDPEAQFILGRMYSTGTGVVQNYQLAYVWESLAAEQGHELAIQDINILATKIPVDQLTEARDIQNQIQYTIENPSDF